MRGRADNEFSQLFPQSLREQHHGLAIDLGPVPLAHHLEILRALAEGCPGLPAVGLEQIGGRRQHIRHAVAEIDMAVAVKIDAILDVGRRQELRLPDLAGVGADQVAQRQVAALEDFQRRDEFGLEQLRAAAIMRQRRERAHHRQFTHVAGAIVAFERPDRHDQFFWHAELLLDAREQLRVFLHQPFGALDARRDDAGGGVFLEALGMEHAALTPVEGQHGLILRHAGKGLGDDIARNAGGGRVARHGGHEAVEIAPALRRAGGRGEQERGEQDE